MFLGAGLYYFGGKIFMRLRSERLQEIGREYKKMGLVFFGLGLVLLIPAFVFFIFSPH
jgi:hypothetical protein